MIASIRTGSFKRDAGGVSQSGRRASCRIVGGNQVLLDVLDDDDDVVVVVVVVDDATCARLRTEIVGDANPGIVVARRLLLKFMNIKTNFVLVEIHSFSFKKIQHLFLSFVDGVLQP